MATYLARRVAFAVFLVFAVSSVSFVLTRLAPGDYVTESLGIDARRETVERTRARYGLDQPIAEQYRRWLARAVRLDFGRSLLYDRPVADLIPVRAANTAVLAVAALAIATLVGLPLGIVTGTSGSGVVAAALGSASIIFLSLPPLLTSLFLVFLAARTGWLPIGGMGGGSLAQPDAMLDAVRHLVLPATAIALPLAATLERLQSQAMREVLGEPFVLAALARGVPRSRVVWRAALKPALKPVASLYGLMIGTLLSGSFAVEVVTAWPGIGKLMLDALRARDVYLVAGCAASGAMFLALGTFVSDLALAAVDPRARE
jgi:peptide/nickel transport system permease protein